MSLEDFLVDTLTTAIEPGEIVREIIVHRTTRRRSQLSKTSPASLGLRDRRCRRPRRQGFARIGVTGLAGKAYRATNVEKSCSNQATSPKPPPRLPTVWTPTPTSSLPPITESTWRKSTQPAR